MAELNSSSGSLRGASRTKTMSPRVDMTPMVDLMFLLITFFMLTTTLSKPVALSLSMPIKEPSAPTEIAANRTMNICLGKNDKIEWYMGDSEQPLTPPAKETFSKIGIRKVLKERNALAIKTTHTAEKGLIVLIKPGNNSNYKNLVDILDELKISGINTYYILDITTADIDRMKLNGSY